MSDVGRFVPSFNCQTGGLHLSPGDNFSLQISDKLTTEASLQIYYLGLTCMVCRSLTCCRGNVLLWRSWGPWPSTPPRCPAWCWSDTPLLSASWRSSARRALGNHRNWINNITEDHKIYQVCSKHFYLFLPSSLHWPGGHSLAHTHAVPHPRQPVDDAENQTFRDGDDRSGTGAAVPHHATGGERKPLGEGGDVETLEAHTTSIWEAVDSGGLAQSSLLQIFGHVLHRLVDLIGVPEDEPGGQDVLECVAAQTLVDLAVLAEVLRHTSTVSSSEREGDSPCAWLPPSRIWWPGDWNHPSLRQRRAGSVCPQHSRKSGDQMFPQVCGLSSLGNQTALPCWSKASGSSHTIWSTLSSLTYFF